MPSTMFFNLSPEKQEHILDNCLEVFIEKGYFQASTNDMVRRTGISKGSIWHYFDSKEDLYFYLLRKSGQVISEVLSLHRDTFSGDPFTRIREMSIAGLDVYIRYPRYYQLSLTLTQPGMEEIRQRFIGQEAGSSMDEFAALFQDLDDSYFKYGKAATLPALRWMYLGIKTEMIYNPVQLEPEQFKKKFLEDLDQAMLILKYGALQYKFRTGEEK